LEYSSGQRPCDVVHREEKDGCDFLVSLGSGVLFHYGEGLQDICIWIKHPRFLGKFWRGIVGLEEREGGCCRCLIVFKVLKVRQTRFKERIDKPNK
jgi:hypothetical protein